MWPNFFELQKVHDEIINDIHNEWCERRDQSTLFDKQIKCRLLSHDSEEKIANNEWRSEKTCFVIDWTHVWELISWINDSVKNASFFFLNGQLSISMNDSVHIGSVIAESFIH